VRKFKWNNFWASLTQLVYLAFHNGQSEKSSAREGFDPSSCAEECFWNRPHSKDLSKKPAELKNLGRRRSTMKELNDDLDAMLRQFEQARLYGAIEIKLEDGKIVLIRKTENYKPPMERPGYVRNSSR
jgi:hypothetical protein